MKLTRLLSVLIASTWCATLHAQYPVEPGLMPAQYAEPAAGGMPSGCACGGCSGGCSGMCGPGMCGDGSGYCGPGGCGPGGCYGGDVGCGPGGCGPGGCGLFGRGGCGPNDCVEYGGPGCFAQNRLCQRTGRGYIAIDAMMLNRSNNSNIPVIFARATATTSDGTLMNANGPGYGFETLPRATIGYVLPSDNAVEATYFYKDDFDVRTGITTTSNLGSPPLVGSVFNNANIIGLNLRTRVQSGELNLVETRRIINFIAGFRWFELRDRLQFNATKGAATGQSQIDTYNNLLGGQVGMRTGYQWGLFGIEAQGKSGLYVDQASSTTTYTNVVGATAPPKQSGTSEAYINELQAMMTFRPSASVNFRAGYQALWIAHVALAADEFQPFSPFGNTGRSLDHSNVFFHGPFAGAEFCW